MKIALLGDIALIGRYDRTQVPDVEQRVEVIRKLVEDCDCVLANLESPLTQKTSTTACKGVYLRSDIQNVKTLKYMGVTHVTLANNHIYDYGRDGANETLKTLEHAGIEYVGLNGEPAFVNSGTNTIALDGFCCLSANALNYGKKVGQVKMLSLESMEAFLKYCESKHYLPIASVHFGIEGMHYPSSEHMAFFRKLADEHCFILHGNHPHAMQGYESHNDSLLIYAQGNLCFDKTPVTSIHLVPEEKDEERKCYISILEIENNRIINHKSIGLTDLGTNILHTDPSIDNQLSEYCSALLSPTAEILKKRTAELQAQRVTAQSHDLKFFLNRLNYKYIGAYLNGRRHAKAYAEVFKQFKDGDM